MARRTQIQEFPFVEGVHQEIDSRLLPDGYLSACKNVRLRKDGRFGVRADFTAIGNDTATSLDVVPRDLVAIGDALAAFVSPGTVSGDTTLWDVAEYTTTGAEWKPSAVDSAHTSSTRLSIATGLRSIPVHAADDFSATVSCSRMDVAAAGGVIAIAYEVSTESLVRFIRASDGAVILKTFIGGVRPRIIASGTTFFFAAFDSGAGDIKLAKFDPTTDADKTDLANAFTGISFSAYDMVPRASGSGFWIALNATTPATTLRPFNSSGAAGTDITGPATLYDHIAIRETSTRVHLVTVLAAGTCQLRSYTLAGALSTGPTSHVATSDRQPGISDATALGTEAVLVVAENTATENSVTATVYNATTHAAIGGGAAIESTFLAAKPVVAGPANYHHLYGAVIPDGAFFSSLLHAAGISTARTVGGCINKFAAAKPSTDHTPQIAKDSSTGKCYWPTLTVTDSNIARPLLTEFDFPGTARRQTAQMAGVLYIGGGAIDVYDRRIVEPAGYFERPRLISATPSNGAGSLPSSVSLLAALVFEQRDSLGNLVQSDVSDVRTVTMGAADDTITLVTAAPHGPRALSEGLAVSHRSVSGVNQLRRAEQGTLGATIVLLADDTTTRANGIIYTQAGRGALSGTTPQEAPFPADYLWKWGSRILAANADQAFVSREIFPGEQVTWSQAVGFTIPKISERIKGVAALDQRGFLFTAERIYWVAGEGPNDLGEGRYSEPLPLPSSTGLEDWRSLVETPLGLFFQGSNGQFWLIPRDGSPPIWIGQPVRDTLVAFPTVTSATLVTEEQLVSFTCNNTGLTDARVVSYDLRAKTWIVDEFASSTPIVSACSYQGRLAMISAGVVYTEKTTLTPNTFIEHGLTTGTINAFGSGWGKYLRFGLVGEYRGDCDLYARVSYDDGKSYTTLSKIHQLRAASYSVGDTVDVEWTPSRWKAQSIRLDFSARTAGSATEGFVFNNCWLETLKEGGVARKASTFRG
jgi:hypothetical protein